MAFLLDTNVVSELRKAAPDPQVVAWHDAQRRAEAYLSVLVVGEIRQGIERARPRDLAQAEALDRWLVRLVATYRERILPVTSAVAEEWGRLNALPQPVPVIDGLMAATARVHRLVLVTRNVADVARTGIAVVNPFEWDSSGQLRSPDQVHQPRPRHSGGWVGLLSGQDPGETVEESGADNTHRSRK